ncbi:MAG: DUF3040 domain-containing protein [Thermoplasmatota archaeon]
MGWLRRKVPEDLYYGQEEKDKPPYLSLSDHKVHRRDREERRIKEMQRGILDYQMERAEIEDMEREMYRFISDPSLTDQAEVRSFDSGKDRRNASIIILGSLFIMCLLMFLTGVSLLVSIFVTLLMAVGFVFLYHLVKKEQNKREKQRRDDAIMGVGPGPSDWVVLGNRQMEVCFARESVVVPVHYLDIASVNDRVMDHFQGYKVLRNEKVRIAPDPWWIRGALYPPYTPVDDLVVIELTKELDIPSFINPSWMRSRMFTPNTGARKRTDRMIIAIRSDEKDRFIRELNSRLKRRKELEEDGYLDEWN